MTSVGECTAQQNLATPDNIQVRFGLEYVESHPAEATAVLSMPVNRFCNPVTGAPTIAALAILVDAAAGVVNHFRRPPGEWTVSSELSLDVSPDTATDLDGVVLASAYALGPVGTTSLGICTLTHRGSVIGGGTVRSFYIKGDDVDISNRPPETLRRTARTPLVELMALDFVPLADATVLAQRVDPNLNNDIDIVHGGVAAAGLELAASAAINRDRFEAPLKTASLRVNFLRPFVAGADSRYVGTPMRIGRGSAVGDAQAIGDGGKVALTARVTAYS